MQIGKPCLIEFDSKLGKGEEIPKAKVSFKE